MWLLIWAKREIRARKGIRRWEIRNAICLKNKSHLAQSKKKKKTPEAHIDLSSNPHVWLVFSALDLEF